MVRALSLLPSLALAVQVRQEIPIHGQDYASLKTMMLEFAAKAKETGKITDDTAELIQGFIDTIKDELLTALDQDRQHEQNIYDGQVDAVNRCNEWRGAWFGDGGGFVDMNQGVDTNRNGHNDCRAQELVTYNNFTSYCGTFEDRVCTWEVCGFPEGGFANGDSDAVNTYMTCLERFFTQHRGGYETDRKNCEHSNDKHQAQTTLCDGKQKTFENDFCSREAKVQAKCEEYDGKRFDAETELLNVKKQVMELEQIFQAQYVALQHLLCYGDKILKKVEVQIGDDSEEGKRTNATGNHREAITGAGSLDLTSCDAVGDDCEGDYGDDCPQIVYTEPNPFVPCTEPLVGNYPCTPTFLQEYAQYEGSFTPVNDCEACDDDEVKENTWGGGRKTEPTEPTEA